MSNEHCSKSMNIFTTTAMFKKSTQRMIIMNQLFFTSESVTEGHPDKVLIWTRHREILYFQGPVRTGHVHKVMGYLDSSQSKKGD